MTKVELRQNPKTIKSRRRNPATTSIPLTAARPSESLTQAEYLLELRQLWKDSS